MSDVPHQGSIKQTTCRQSPALSRRGFALPVTAGRGQRCRCLTFAALMALFLRPTKLASTAYARLRDWAIVEDGRTVGRIVEDGSASTPPDRRWSWSIVIFVSDRTGVVTSGRAPTLSEAKADFRRNWESVRA